MVCHRACAKLERLATSFEEVEPAAFGKKVYVFGEGGEDAAGEEFGDFFWRVLEF
jgi:hypothetical protein